MCVAGVAVPTGGDEVPAAQPLPTGPRPATNVRRRRVLSPRKQLRFALFKGGGRGLVVGSDLAELMHLSEWGRV